MKTPHYVATVLLLLNCWCHKVQADESTHRAAAQAFLEAAGIREMVGGTLEEELAAVFHVKPGLAPYEGVIREFAKNHLGWVKAWGQV